MATNSFLGNDYLQLGPANVYVKKRFVNSVETDWASASDWVALGDSESTTMRQIVSKTDLTASQRGTRPADKVVTAQQVQFETSLGKAYLERLESIQQGLRLERNTAGEVTQWKIVKVLGERDSANNVELWVKVVEFDAGAESTDPLKTTYAKVAPSSDQVELVYDAASQRFYNVMFEAYENDEGSYTVSYVEDGVTRYAYCWSAEVV